MQLEEPFLDKAQEKMVELAHSIQHLEERSLSGGKRSFSVSSRQLDFTFIEDAVNELLRCRRVLKATYGYGYYVTGIISTKQFEHMQVSHHTHHTTHTHITPHTPHHTHITPHKPHHTHHTAHTTRTHHTTPHAPHSTHTSTHNSTYSCILLHV